MIIHIWMHWFWITTFVFKGFLLSLSRHSSFVVEAGLPDLAEEYGTLRDKLVNYASHDDGARGKRTVEDEDVAEEAATVPGNETVSNEATSGEAYRGAVTSDVEDAHGGADGFYPLKKYMKYAKYGKLKSKPAAVAANATSEPPTAANVTQTEVAENETTTTEEVTVEQTIANTSKGVVEPEATEPTVVNVTDTPEVHREANLSVESKLDETVLQTTVEPLILNNRVAAATSSESRERLSQPNLDAGSITGITLGIVVISGFIGAISFVLYRRRYLNKPQALNDKCSNLDSSGYIDDTSLRENSEEMYSLDNDSFLNSLEAMTIQNYWTENVKHTKL
ncbi:UNVERIFIED_CONTAM: hypothetical protein PYX00_010007 [Menopon gallinae]|uniref:Uncharacterized protein n=1 Tax=Menopon gallinae TaxID=328185 RepID=A0AAW2HDJ7_9NEOP